MMNKSKAPASVAILQLIVAAFFFANGYSQAATVVDEQGKPVAKFQAMFNTADHGCTAWESGIDGDLPRLHQFRDAPVVDVLLRAPRYAPSFTRFVGEEVAKLNDGTSTITLKRGDPIEFRFELPAGMSWPADLTPDVHFVEIHDRNRMMRQPENRKNYPPGAAALDFAMLVEHKADGVFTLRLAEDTPAFYVGIHAPGFLQFFDVGPYTLADVNEGVLTVSVPQPATLNVEFEPPKDGKPVPFEGVSLSILKKISSSSGTYCSVASEKANTTTLDFEADDLSPGEYRVMIRTTPKADVSPLPGTEINPGSFYDTWLLDLQAGQRESIEATYEPPSLEAYRGDRTAVLQLRMSDGTPMAGKPITVTYSDGHYGSVPVFSGTVPEGGEIELDNLTDKAPAGWSYGPYSVSTGDKRLGFFGFEPGENTVSVELRMPPEAGDMAPHVELTEVGTGRMVSLASLRGKIVWLEFWATWCGPCQRPMQELAKLATDQPAHWNGRVELAPVSIDDRPEAVVSHSTDRGWQGLPLYWTGVAGTAKDRSFSAPAASAFGVNGVPTAFLIDPEGQIVWRGHPSADVDGKNFVERINELLE